MLVAVGYGFVPAASDPHMQHPTFPKITTRLPSTAVGGGAWVATEKVHGAQLVVAATPDATRFGKRKAWLQDDDAFFGWQLIAPQLRQAAQVLVRELGGPVVVYGELCGGHYPHDDVEPVPGLTAVQTGIWYAPDLRYVVFDVRVHASEDAFVSHDDVQQLCEVAQLTAAPTLGRGRRSDLERLPTRFASHVPRLFGLPTIAGNDAEGYVLKPTARVSAQGRPLTKHKIPEFDDARFDRSVPFDADAQLHLDDLLTLCRAMCNPARLASARSKVGDADDDVCEEVVLDVLVDLESMFPRRMRTLGEDETEALQQRLLGLANDLART